MIAHRSDREEGGLVTHSRGTNSFQEKKKQAHKVTYRVLGRKG
jgi:hypothetical protein